MTTDLSSAADKSGVNTLHVYVIFAGQLFDPLSRVFLANRVITVDGDVGVILDVADQLTARPLNKLINDLYNALSTDCSSDAARFAPGVEVKVTYIDHRNEVILPGLVDVHVHFFLHPYSETSWEDQLTKESLSERTVRATVHARQTLLSGFTTVRDLGTEGAFDADIGLRKCLAGRNAIIPGPRYYCATRAIISGGAYGPKSSLYPAQEGIDGIKGAEFVDGTAECIKEVRKQIGAGADWIKLYADYSCRTRTADVSLLAAQSIRTFDKEELRAIISTAHGRGVKVAAHANTAASIDDLLDLGVNTIEHGSEIYEEGTGDTRLLRKFAREHDDKTWWVPTLAAYYTSYNDAPSPHTKARWDACQASFRKALQLGMENIACGGDTGVFAHGKNALELVLMRKLGASWDRVLSWATFGGWKCIKGVEWEGEKSEKRRGANFLGGYPELVKTGFRPDSEIALERGIPFGAIRPGWAADLIAVQGQLDGSIEQFEDALFNGVRLVMKGGKIYKGDGQV